MGVLVFRTAFQDHLSTIFTNRWARHDVWSKPSVFALFSSIQVWVWLRPNHTGTMEAASDKRSEANKTQNLNGALFPVWICSEDYVQ